MKKCVATWSALFLGIAMLAIPGRAQQDKTKRLSPPAHAQCKFASGKTVNVDYSSPRMRGRKIYGGLVPWGKVWRLGANEATTFVTDTDVIVGGKKIPAGSYTLDAIPNPHQWTLIINKKTKNAKGGPVWGIPYPGARYDLARVLMQVSPLSKPLEDLTISFQEAGSACTMRVDWAMTRVSIKLNEGK